MATFHLYREQPCDLSPPHSAHVLVHRSAPVSYQWDGVGYCGSRKTDVTLLIADGGFKGADRLVITDSDNLHSADDGSTDLDRFDETLWRARSAKSPIAGLPLVVACQMECVAGSLDWSVMETTPDGIARACATISTQPRASWPC